MDRTVQLPQFSVGGYRTRTKLEVLSTGQYTCSFTQQEIRIDAYWLPCSEYPLYANFLKIQKLLWFINVTDRRTDGRLTTA